ncbi:MAG: serine/threonine protein kinase with repeat, partial [Myxococcales bacterium]|nr:serine/threonine protein kinase with repeat [Myxococcales bacterium]
IDDGRLFLAMEFLAGESLSSVIKAGPVPRERALKVVRQILRGLEHAHAAGVVHRDLKPDNIMLVERDGQTDVVKILDFGIAKVTAPVSGGGANGNPLTQAGVIFGTPEYLSPEQALGEVVDARADIYAAGVILYEMLAGRKPFESEDKVKIISMHLAHVPPRIRDVAPSSVDVPVALEQVVLQALEKSRENRFATATAFLQALEDAEAPEPAFAEDAATPTPTGAADRFGGFLSGRRALALALVVAAAAGTAVYKRGAPHRELVAAPTRPAPPPPALADRLKKIEAALEDGNTSQARLALEHELSERPRDARIRYMLGRVAFAEGRHGDAIGEYRDAITLDAGFRGDPVLLGHLETALGESRNADEALDLVVEKIGAPATDLLVQVANESAELTRRQRAASALDDLGKGDKVDRVGLATLQLKKAGSCEEKKMLVEKLRDLGDPRALPALRGLRGHNIGGLIRLGGTNVRCMKKELPEAIKELEKKAGASEYKASR